MTDNSNASIEEGNDGYEPSSVENDKYKSYIDENMNSHVVDVDKVLGRGGQGIVYRTEDPNIALKLALKDSNEITDPGEIEHFRQTIRKLLLLQLPKDIKVSAPIAVLKDNAGYIMKMLSTAKSFEFFLPRNIKFNYFSDFNKCISFLSSYKDAKIIKQKKDQMTEAGKSLSIEVVESVVIHENTNNEITINLSEQNIDFKSETSNPLLRYALTGGLRLRLLALGLAASQLAKIHSLGLVYGDISSKNVYFVPENGEKTTVWFIDADNLDYEKKRGIVVYTPQYGAPELIQKGPDGNTIDGIRTVSDCHAFAVLISLVLSWVHPFIGKAVLAGSDFADEVDVEDQALEGRLPWIDDPEDDSNSETSINRALPRNIIYTPYIRQLLKLTFCEGRTHPFLRPSIYHWVRALIKAHDQTIKCQNPECGMTLYYDGVSKEYKCPCCDHVSRQYFITFKSYRLTNKGRFSNYDWMWTKEIDDNEGGIKLAIPTRVFEPFDNRTFDDDYLYIKSNEKSKDYLSFQKNFNVLSSRLFLAKKNNNDKNDIFSEIKLDNFIVSLSDLKQPDNIWLMCVTKYGYHRLISVALQGVI